MNKTADILFEYLKNVLYHPAQAELDLDSLPPDFQKLGKGMQFLADCIQEERHFMTALAKGDLALDPPRADNVLASPAKALQASLRHLQWQTQQVAKGDYSQHVDFMGEFSQAFNTMTAQLQERKNIMLAEKNLAYIDPLTGLNNRRYALNRMEQWIQEGTPFLLSFIDLDYLKYCNDTFGHESGDEYLINTSNLLLTTHCEVCRIGGDEFILLSTAMDADLHDQQLAWLRELLISQSDTPYPKSFSFATTEVPAFPEASLAKYMKVTDEKMQQYKLKNKKSLSDVIYKDDRI